MTKKKKQNVPGNQQGKAKDPITSNPRPGTPKQQQIPKAQPSKGTQKNPPKAQPGKGMQQQGPKAHPGKGKKKNPPKVQQGQGKMELYNIPEEHSDRNETHDQDAKQDDEKKYFSWGCAVQIHPDTKFPVSAVINHVRGCDCPGEDHEGILFVILERGYHLHESNVVKYMIPVVNNMARQAAIDIGLNLDRGIESLPMYKDKVEWKDGKCIEALGRGFTAEEFEALHRLPKGQMLCTWLI